MGEISESAFYVDGRDHVQPPLAPLQRPNHQSLCTNCTSHSVCVWGGGGQHDFITYARQAGLVTSQAQWPLSNRGPLQLAKQKDVACAQTQPTAVFRKRLYSQAQKATLKHLAGPAGTCDKSTA